MGESDLQKYAVIKKLNLNFLFSGLKQSLKMSSQILSI